MGNLLRAWMSDDRLVRIVSDTLKLRRSLAMVIEAIERRYSEKAPVCRGFLRYSFRNQAARPTSELGYLGGSGISRKLASASGFAISR
jgi:hypothetical protein